MLNYLPSSREKINLAEIDLSHEMYLRHQKKEPVILKFITVIGILVVMGIMVILANGK